MTSRAEIERLLPGVFARTLEQGGPLSALVEVMSALHAPSENVLTELDSFFDPLRAPDRFVPFLARWVNLDRLFDEPLASRSSGASRAPLSTGLERLRALIAAAAHLSQWRGTGRGLILFLETATGTRGFTIEERVLDQQGQPLAFHIRVLAPDSARTHTSLIQRIVESEKPAHVSWELAFHEQKQETS